MVEVGGFEPVLGSSSINLLRTLQFWVFSSLEIKEPFLEIELLNSFNYDVVLLAYSNLSGDSLHSPIKQAYNTNV